jgi:hypothetical protein
LVAPTAATLGPRGGLGHAQPIKAAAPQLGRLYRGRHRSGDFADRTGDRDAFLFLGADLFRKACEFGLEGMVSKRSDRAYRAGRCTHWIKVKNRKHPAFSRVKDQFYASQSL